MAAWVLSNGGRHNLYPRDDWSRCPGCTLLKLSSVRFKLLSFIDGIAILFLHLKSHTSSCYNENHKILVNFASTSFTHLWITDILQSYYLWKFAHLCDSLKVSHFLREDIYGTKQHLCSWRTESSASIQRSHWHSIQYLQFHFFWLIWQNACDINWTSPDLLIMFYR